MNKSSQKKIFILINSLVAGGAERQSIYLTKALSSNYDVKLIVYYGEKYHDKNRELSKNISDNIIWLYGNHITKLFRLFVLFRSNRNAVIISYLALSNLVNAIVGKLAGVKIKIGGIRNSIIDKRKIYAQKFMHNKIFSYTVSNNFASYSYLVDCGFNADKLVVIQNCIDNIPNYFIRSKNKAPVSILSLSRFEPQKDLMVALKAICVLKNDFKEKNFQYLLCGYGVVEQKLRDFVEQNELQDCVKIIIHPNVDSVLMEADIFLNTSIFEGTSNSIMEAMTYGLPVVATDVGDTKYLVEDCNSGYICQVGDFYGIAKRLQQLIESHDLRIRFGQNSHNKIKTEFSVEKMRSHYINLVEST